MWTPRGKGCKPSLPDPRNYTLRLGTPLLPASVDLRGGFSLPIRDQGQENGCVGAADAYAHRFVQSKEGGPLILPSQEFAYYNARLSTGDVGNDDGSTITDGLKGLAKYGVCDESLWPLNPATILTIPPPAAYDAALPYKAITYAQLPVGPNGVPTVETIKQTLASGYPVLFGWILFAQSEGSAVADGNINLPGANDTPIGGHAGCLMGYDDNHRSGDFLNANSWGTAYGDQGYMHLPYAYLTEAVAYNTEQIQRTTTLSYDFWTFSREGLPLDPLSTAIASVSTEIDTGFAQLEAEIAGKK